MAISAPFSVLVSIGLLLAGSGVCTALQENSHQLAGGLVLGLATGFGGAYVGTAVRLRARARTKAERAKN